MDEVEKIARRIALHHGSAYEWHVPGEGSKTVAAMRGYGSWGDSPSRYAEQNWQKYRGAAEAMIAYFSKSGDGS